MYCMTFKQWYEERELQENFLNDLGGMFVNAKSVAERALSQIRHPSTIPTNLGKLISDEWHSLIEKYGKTEAMIIMASLVIALGPGLLVPGSMALVWITIALCKFYNTMHLSTPKPEVTSLTKDQVKAEVTAIKSRLIEKAKQIEGQ